MTDAATNIPIPDPDDSTEGVDEQAQYEAAFAESIDTTLDLRTWTTGEDLSELYGRIYDEVREALEQEDRTHQHIRDLVFPRLAGYLGAPKCAGLQEVTLTDLEKVHRGLLFNGGVEACDGNRHVHDTLPLTITQIGVSLVSYQGNQGTYVHRLYRRDLRSGPGLEGTVAEALELLERREDRGALNHEDQGRGSDLWGRAIMSYAERALLLRESSAVWRMGHGNPAPFELITGSGMLALMIEATKVIRDLVCGHQKFVYVASEPKDRALLSIGQALRPLEYAVVGRLSSTISAAVEGHYRMAEDKVAALRKAMVWNGEQVDHPHKWIKRFRDEVASKVVYGVFRASQFAPPQVFYAHEDHAHVAARIALADSVLQSHRGFPMLLDIADHTCAAIFGADTLSGPVGTADEPRSRRARR